MCDRPDLEAEEQELDRQLRSLFHRWKAYGMFWQDADDRPLADGIEEFCRDVRDRLPELLGQEKEGVRADTGGPGQALAHSRKA